MKPKFFLFVTRGCCPCVPALLLFYLLSFEFWGKNVCGNFCITKVLPEAFAAFDCKSSIVEVLTWMLEGQSVEFYQTIQETDSFWHVHNKTWNIMHHFNVWISRKLMKKMLEGAGEESQELCKSAGHDWLMYVVVILWHLWEWRSYKLFQDLSFHYLEAESQQI